MRSLGPRQITCSECHPERSEGTPGESEIPPSVRDDNIRKNLFNGVLAPQPFLRKIQNWRAAGLYRRHKKVDAVDSVTLYIDRKKYLSFSGNNYLGLAHHPQVKKAALQALQDFGVGSTAAALVCGYSKWHHELEYCAAEFLQRDKALLFSNGYMANLGVLSTLMGTDDHIYQDKFNHASLLDGGKLSAAKSLRYPHHDLLKLEQYLMKASGNKIIVSDSVFSVNGDIVKLPELITLAKKYQAALMIDDAHGLGVLGEHGGGISDYYVASQEDLPILVCPLGKAIGCYGAIVAGSSELIEQLIQFCRSYIYTTAIPAAVAAAAVMSFSIIKNDVERRKRLQHNIAYFRRVARQRNLIFHPSITAIQAFPVGEADHCQQLAEKLMQRGFLVAGLRPPTTPRNAAILRIALSSEHTTSHLDALLEALADEYHGNI